MPQITFSEAIRNAILEEMRADSRVFVMGEDIEFTVYSEAKSEFARGRIRNTPICETGFVGAAIGAALTGTRPIVEIGCSTFLYSAMDQIVNQAAKSRYMFGGQASVPLVIRTPVVYSISLAAHHSDRPWGIFAQAVGLKIIVPSNPYDAKGLMKSAIRDGNPVLCFEDCTLMGERGEVPDDNYTVPIGEAHVCRQGSDVTVVAIAGAVNQSLAAAATLQSEGISLEVIDLRSAAPLDRHTMIRSVRKTGRLIVVDPAPGTCGIAAEMAASATESALLHLKAAPVRITAPHVPVPFSPELERLMYPTTEGIAAAARKLCAER